jgi:hypothetical protein
LISQYPPRPIRPSKPNNVSTNIVTLRRVSLKKPISVSPGAGAEGHSREVGIGVCVPVEGLDASNAAVRRNRRRADQREPRRAAVLLRDPMRCRR